MHSDKLDQIVPALINAQKQFKPVTKDSTNPYFNSKYANLETCILATQDALRDNGLVVVQNFDTDPNALVTTLYHVSGQYISGGQLLKPSKEDPQGYKAAATYARRSALLAILGIAEEDDDGNAASQPVRQPSTQRAPQAQQTQPQGYAGDDNIDFESLPSSGAPTEGGVAGEVDFEVNIQKPSHKTGSTSRGPWERWAVKTQDDKWLGTFDKKCGAVLDANINRVFVLSCNRSAKGDGYDIVGWRLKE